MPVFIDIVEEVASLSISEMEELKRIIEKVIIERKRGEIFKLGEEEKQEYAENKLTFYDNVP